MTIRAFSVKSLRFDHLPTDADLAWLLGDSDCMESVKIEETAERLIARPRLIPMKFVVPWLILTFTVIMAAPWWIPLFGGDFGGREKDFYVIFGGYGLVVVPAMIVLFGHMHDRFAAKGDYFRLDKRTGRLELPAHGRTIAQDELIAITYVSRLRPHIGNKVGGPARLLARPDGQFEHLGIFGELESVAFNRSAAERLADALGLPLRRVTLSRAASKTLNDA